MGDPSAQLRAQGGAWRTNSELRADLAEASAAEMCFCRRCAAKTPQEPSCAVPIAATMPTEPIDCSARPPNGEGAKLRGQGPRAETEAARRLPACEVRDAGGVTPCKLR